MDVMEFFVQGSGADPPENFQQIRVFWTIFGNKQSINQANTIAVNKGAGPENL